MTSIVAGIGDALGITKNSIRGLNSFISDIRACTSLLSLLFYYLEPAGRIFADLDLVFRFVT